MIMNDACIYCTEGYKTYMTKIAELEVSTVYLNKDQGYRGRCYVALNEHRTELFDLEDDLLFAYMRDVARTAKAVMQAAKADKINYAAYGDTHRHLHFHIVPKHMNGPGWGGAFELFGGTRLGVDEEAETIAKIGELLVGGGSAAN